MIKRLLVTIGVMFLFGFICLAVALMILCAPLVGAGW